MPAALINIIEATYSPGSTLARVETRDSKKCQREDAVLESGLPQLWIKDFEIF